MQTWFSPATTPFIDYTPPEEPKRARGRPKVEEKPEAEPGVHVLSDWDHGCTISFALVRKLKAEYKVLIDERMMGIREALQQLSESYSISYTKVHAFILG